MRPVNSSATTAIGFILAAFLLSPRAWASPRDHPQNGSWVFKKLVRKPPFQAFGFEKRESSALDGRGLKLNTPIHYSESLVRC
jgi:hypothetical protein